MRPPSKPPSEGVTPTPAGGSPGPVAAAGGGRRKGGVRPGTLIADKYRVERELGRGGFGIVVRAVHLQLDQVVAIKVLTPGDGGSAEWAEDAERFRREAKATAALKGEHIVRILDVDIVENTPIMVMEYLEGETLHVALHTRTVSVADAVDHVIQMLAALGEAHSAGIVHRDLKPANIFLAKGPGGSPVVKVLDFGVSKMGIGTVTSGRSITRTGAVIGTVAYMAPEQMVDAKRVDARADLWSVGVILFELLTKQLPFGPADSPTLVTSILTGSPASLAALRPDVPPKLEAVLARLLQKAPEHRYASAASAAKALAELATPRARAALDSLRRGGPPRGAAAPAEKGRPRLPGAAAEARRVSPVMLVAGAGAVATVALLGLSIGVLVASPKPARRELADAVASSVAPGRPVAAGTAKATKLCDPPWTLDEDAGVKRPKPECL